MNQEALTQRLSSLIAKWENEVIEFKQVPTDYKTDKIGEYFSALANEANIRGVECAWLVFGVDNKTRQVQGTDYRSNPEQLQSTKQQIRENTALPDYDLAETGVVKMVIYGAVVDEAYSRVLMQKTDLPLVDIIALDHVQKGRELDEERIKHLRKLKLIEGRKPNFHISAAVASVTDQKAEYIRMRAQDDAFYAKLVLDFIEKFGSATRKDINSLLFSKLSELLSEKQKTIKINSLITKMRRSALIENEGSDKKSVWKITK